MYSHLSTVTVSTFWTFANITSRDSLSCSCCSLVLIHFNSALTMSRSPLSSLSAYRHSLSDLSHHFLDILRCRIYYTISEVYRITRPRTHTSPCSNLITSLLIASYSARSDFCLIAYKSCFSRLICLAMYAKLLIEGTSVNITVTDFLSC